MTTFINDDFLLNNDISRELYHKYSETLPVIDYHCHLDPKQIAEDKIFDNLTQVWLNGDHYKWRAMRAFGINEEYITGNASDRDKFKAWAKTVPYTLRNPLYHWTHLELKRYFGIDELLNESNADKIFDEVSEKLKTKEFSVRSLLKKMNVETVCTTDDPVDSLEYHKAFKKDKPGFKMLPAWRPDKVMKTEDAESWNKYIDELEQVSGVKITDFDLLLEALRKRHDFFHENGCRLSDHGLDTFYVEKYTAREVNAIVKKLRSEGEIDSEAASKFKSAILYELAVMDHDKNWVQQFHVGALRNTNERQFEMLGPDTGYDSINDKPVAEPMAKFLSRLAKGEKLTKTILYNLNPAQNEVFATMTGNFQDGSVPGKIQWGSAWWFLDQKDGITKHLNTLSNMGLISLFVGMLTDSRSFLSFPRHEYFRRIVSNLFGGDMAKGEIPGDMETVGGIISDISYYNAKRYFDF